MEDYNDDNVDRYSPLFDIFPTDNWPQQPDDEQPTENDLLMDVDTATISQLAANTVDFSDMVWSPIPTQSTLNNWHMLTQSLSQDGFDQHSQRGCSDEDDGQSYDGAAMEDVVELRAEVRAPRMQSPDMFAESPTVLSPPSPFIEPVDDGDVLMTREDESLVQPTVTDDCSRLVDEKKGENNVKVVKRCPINDWHMNSEKLDNNCPIEDPQLVVIKESQVDTIPETTMQRTTSDYNEEPNDEQRLRLFEFTKPKSISSVRVTTVETQELLNTIPETHVDMLTQLSVQHTIPETPNLKITQSITCTIPETPASPAAVEEDADATFCSIIEEELQHTSIVHLHDYSTLCSELLPKTTQPQQVAHIALKVPDMDMTFCSLVELELQQTRQRDTEAFDFEDAIMRILNVDALQEMLVQTADSPDALDRRLPEHSDNNEVTESVVRRQQATPSQSGLNHQHRIEQIVLRFLMDLAGPKKMLYLDVQRLGWSGCLFDTESQTLSFSPGCDRRRVRTRHKIILLLHLMDIVYSSLGSTTNCTQRELFYNEPDLTQNVQNISFALRDISCMLGTQPWHLGVLSTSRGLVAGPLNITLNTGEQITYDSRDHRGSVLPHMTTSVQRVTSTARFVLLVEKDTVFNKLLLDNVIGMFRNRCILLTGKGYPDINTRYLLNQMWRHLGVPIYVLCDADPHGLQIMLTYRFGSVALPMCTEQLAVPSIRWLGVRPSECTGLGLATRPLSQSDVRLLKQIGRRPYVDEPVRLELQWLLTHGHKAEIEALEGVAKGHLLRTYLAERLREYVDE